MKELGKTEHQICRKLAHAIVPLHASHSSRNRNSSNIQQGLMTLFLTILHWVVYVLLQYGFLLTAATVLVCPFLPALKPWVQWPFRFATHFAIYDFPAWVWACAQTHLGPTLVIGGLLLIGLYYVGKAEPLRMSLLGAALVYLIIQGRGWASLPSPLSQTSSAENQPVSIAANPQPVRSMKLGSEKLKPKTSNSSLPPSNSNVVTYQPAVSFQTTASTFKPSSTLYDPKILESEIKSLPVNCVVKDYPMTPDESMPGDVAVSRMQDITDPDKYTMMIGDGKQIIGSVNPTNTTLTIQYKSTDPFGLLGGGNGVMNFLWEDVKYIHANEIDIETKNPTIIYQCSLVVSGSKYPLTLQCATAEDLEHLVSTMQYFIRHSRLAHDTALGGMPYLNKGMQFNNDGLITKLWAGSPADKAGLTCGEYLWSLGKNTEQPQNKKTLEAGLQSSTPQNLYVTSAAEHQKLNGIQMSGQPRAYPKRTVVHL